MKKEIALFQSDNPSEVERIQRRMAMIREAVSEPIWRYSQNDHCSVGRPMNTFAREQITEEGRGKR